MKSGVKITLWSLVALVVANAAHGITDDSNPYGRIVERNVFSLKDPPPPPPPPAPPIPKITLQGITSILGRRQVLFKMQRQGGKEESYVLNEGEREGDLEVLAIDEVAGSIKFNNQGTIQTLTMDKDASKPPAVAAPAAATAALPRPIPTVAAQGRPAGVPSPSPPPAAGGGSGVTAVGGQAAMRTIPTRTRRTGEEAGGSLAVASQPAEPAITPEEQTILMELDREANRDLIQKGEYPPPPPTELTPQGSYGMPELPPPPAE